MQLLNSSFKSSVLPKALEKFVLDVVVDGLENPVVLVGNRKVGRVEK